MSMLSTISTGAGMGAQNVFSLPRLWKSDESKNPKDQVEKSYLNKTLNLGLKAGVAGTIAAASTVGLFSYVGAEVAPFVLSKLAPGVIPGPVGTLIGATAGFALSAKYLAKPAFATAATVVGGLGALKMVSDAVK
ncbi:MAG: hypothetical protein HYU64_12960 [Armatimonadetes bacterium]|nr:hypothetical protein [Armatimonadota bacterium]